MSEYYSLDELCSPLFEEKGSEKMRFHSITHSIGMTVLLSLGGLAFLAWQGLNPLALLDGKDIRSLLKDKDMMTYFSQYERYCKPSILHRIGNGFDSATCQEKFDAMVAYTAHKKGLTYSGPSMDIDARIEENDSQFRERLSNLEKLGGMH